MLNITCVHQKRFLKHEKCLFLFHSCISLVSFENFCTRLYVFQTYTYKTPATLQLQLHHQYPQPSLYVLAFSLLQWSINTVISRFLQLEIFVTFCGSFLGSKMSKTDQNFNCENVSIISFTNASINFVNTWSIKSSKSNSWEWTWAEGSMVKVL